MNALDALLAETLASLIKEKLGNRTFQKIEKRIKERYDMSVEESVTDFQKMDATLREFFGPGADAMEKDLVRNFISIDGDKHKRPWIVIENQKLAKFILESFGNTDKKKILDASLQRPDIILNVLESCNIPKSSGYRVVKELIDDGLLTEKGFTKTNDGKKINKYVSIFENLKIDIQGSKVIIKMQINEEFIKESYILNVVQGK